jgi:hypothetical protein
MKKCSILLPVFALVLLVGCASTVLEKKDYQSYTLGQTLSAPVGGTFLVDQKGTVKKFRHWVGVMNSPDGWKVDEEYSPDYVRKELIYSGVSGTIIEIAYREYRGGLATPAFFQSVKYDLAESKTVRFQQFEIEVLSATNQGITCKLLHD